MSITLIIGTGPPLDDGGIPDGRDEEHMDIDRWENDGGRSLVQYKTTVITRKRIGN